MARRDKKVQPIGVCDHCLGPIPPGQWYTSKRQVRLHCSIDCRNAANSQAGKEIVAAKTRERVRNGTWHNPADIRRPDPAVTSATVSQARKREVAAGTWRNPALDPAAREKLSRPRKYSGALASAIEKLHRGSMADLSEEERQAYRAYAREMYHANADYFRERRQQWCARRVANLTDEQRQARREKWRQQRLMRKHE